MIADLRDSVAVITGGSGGIGSALARQFALEGARIVLADLDEAELANVSRALVDETGADVLAVRTDVADADDVEALADAAVRRFGRVNLLCNNAGVVAGGLAWDISLADWRRVIDVDLWGVINGIRTFVPILIRQDRPAHLVNIASMAGVTSLPSIAPYVAAKHGVVALSETLAHDLNGIGSNVGVSVVCPGYVPTHLGLPDRTMPLPSARQGEPTARDVAVMVREAIATDGFYVFTHPKSKESVRARMAAVLDERLPPPNS